MGNTTVTWTVTDAAGNTAQCTQTVTVLDNIDPTITCPSDITVNADAGACEATGITLASPVAGDNCTNVTVANDAPAVYPVGVTPVTWTVTDDAGNTTQCVQLVTVVDAEAPTISCPGDRVVYGTCGLPEYSQLATVADNCSTNMTIVQSPAAGTAITGTTTVILTVTDSAGNSSNCTFDVTLQDATAPTISCPSDMTLDLGN